MEQTLRIFDFNILSVDNSFHDSESDDESSASDKKSFKDSSIFLIQIFGVNEIGKTFSVTVEGFKPFFYVMVNDTWNITTKEKFLAHIKIKMGKFYEDSISECIIIKRKKLYGFDGGKEHKFIKLEFNSFAAFNKAKNIWYSDWTKDGRKLLENGYIFNNTEMRLYEANIPPLLRFFHIKDISPSGWIAIPNKTIKNIDIVNKRTSCDFEFSINQKHIIPLNDKETIVPYKICSFDIEASSSHGDFPIPVKTYKKLATNIIEYIEKLKMEITPELCKNILKRIINAAFGYEQMDEIDIVYPKKKPKTKQEVDQMCEKWLVMPVRSFIKTDEFNEINTLEKMFDKLKNKDENDDDEAADHNFTKYVKSYSNKTATIVDIILDKKFERDGKLDEINISLNSSFPSLEGDKVTFIGSTFMKYGNQEPYMNHCIALNTCSPLQVENSILESYQTEKEVLLAWQKMIQRENPDIIIGYNIFGFDYMFMFKRAEENNCIEEFLKLSRNKDEICAAKDRDTGKYKLEESTIQIASGQHDLKFIKINGRLQVDLYNFFRREENLSSYKLDYVAGHFIGDFIKSFDHKSSTETEIKTMNMTGLLEGSFVHFEEIGHSIDYYANGAKFKVIYVDKLAGKFCVEGNINPDTNKKVRWCLAKDDVTPKDIFRMTNGSADDRAVIAKYCIQDCNLVHYLFNKADILTGFIEMAKICSVPVNFLVMRGQGIKLTSYIAKKCREKRTLMPVIEKGSLDDGFEGAIVLEPKCDLYLDNPVACVDYASLYPSCMMSENLSHDSKVWTREYDLAGNLIEETGEKNSDGDFIYDNLPNYSYVNIEYDTYKYIRKSPASAPEKIKSGIKKCRFAQFPEGKRAIMPSILEELLTARKTTRKLIPQQTDEFMKNVLDKRQLGYKVTANSLYGQCGAKTSTFYEMDIAAATTATGRLLLIYAQKIIEECYGNSICDTKHHGPVLTKAEYIYGDSVANYTPVYVSTFMKGEAKEEINRVVDILTIEQLAEKYGNNNWIRCLEPGKQEKEVCELDGIDTWTDKGWTKLHRVIRHKLASHKKMIRILTHTGLVDVTDDHSLITKDGNEISPKDVKIGSELLHNQLPKNKIINNIITEDEAQIMGFFFGDGSCGEYDCPSGKKASWALNNASLDIIDKYIKLCKKVYPEFDWVVMPTLESSGVYKIAPKHNETTKYGSIVNFVRLYRKKLYYNKSKIIPNEIINNNKDIQQAFFYGLYDADGDKDVNGITRIDQKNQISTSHICWLASNLGWNTSLNTRKDKPDIYRVTMTKSKQRKNPNAIKKMLEIPYEGYVYDLTTENHHFAAGVGNLIVHNTDSVFFTFNLQTPEGIPIRGKEALEITIELAQEAGHLASGFLKGPHDLEYEKTFMPFCLLSKKRYVGMLYETDPNKCKRKEMGIVLKRRDNAPIVKDIYGGVIDILMKEQNIQKAIDFLKSSLQNLVDEKVTMDKLIITKSLRSGYKNPNAIAHKVLADRITKRDPGNKPSSGDRIPYVYINSTNKKALQGEKIETPTYILDNKIKIDYSFYITNQIMKPLQQLFALVLEKIWELQNKKSKISKFKKEIETLRKSCDPDKFEDKLEQLKNKEVKILLFDEYLRVTNNEKDGNQSLTKFFGKK
jgi:DNA polymerase elongation subunit (family B)